MSGQVVSSTLYVRQTTPTPWFLWSWLESGLILLQTKQGANLALSTRLLPHVLIHRLSCDSFLPFISFFVFSKGVNFLSRMVSIATPNDFIWNKMGRNLKFLLTPSHFFYVKPPSVLYTKSWTKHLYFYFVFWREHMPFPGFGV